MGKRVWRHWLGLMLWIAVLSGPALANVQASSLQVNKQSAPHILFINPSNLTDPFWSLVTRLIKASCVDLAIDCEIEYAENDRFLIKEMIGRVSMRTRKPDYIIASFPMGVSESIFEVLEKAKIPLVTIGISLLGQKKKPVETGKHRLWLREYVLNQNYLADLLIRSLREQGLGLELPGDEEAARQSIPLIAFTPGNDPVGELRLDSIKSRLKTLSQGQWVLQHIETNAEDDSDSIQTVRRYFKRFPHIKYIWTDGAELSEAVLGGLLAEGIPVESKVLVSFDPMLEKVGAVNHELIKLLIGGQFIMGVCAVVEIYDYHYGYEIPPVHKEDFIFEVLASNAASVSSRLTKKDWERLDYRSFSRHARKTWKGLKDLNCRRLEDYL